MPEIIPPPVSRERTVMFEVEGFPQRWFYRLEYDSNVSINFKIVNDRLHKITVTLRRVFYKIPIVSN